MTSYGARATIVAALLAQFSGGIRGQHDSGRAFVRGSIVGEDEGASSNDNVVISGSHGGDGETISLERRHRHNYDGGQSEDAMDSGFDFYAYSMTYQPEFCRANNEKFAGCHTFMEDWEGQLTIHGLWPNVSISIVFLIVDLGRNSLWISFAMAPPYLSHVRSFLAMPEK